MAKSLQFHEAFPCTSYTTIIYYYCMLAPRVYIYVNFGLCTQYTDPTTSIGSQVESVCPVHINLWYVITSIMMHSNGNEWAIPV